MVTTDRQLVAIGITDTKSKIGTGYQTMKCLSLPDYAQYLCRLVPKFIKRYEIYKDELCLHTESAHLLGIMQFLRDHNNALFKQVSDITAVDWPSKERRFEVVYNLLSYHYSTRVRVKLQVDELEPVPTLSYLFPGANWYEREVYDMFGIIFAGHPDLRRILTDYGFEGHPLRKDFPLSGHLQIRYDEERKRIIQEPLDMTQEFRKFDFLSPVIFASMLISLVATSPSKTRRGNGEIRRRPSQPSLTFARCSINQMSSATLDALEGNARGIPKAPFIDDIAQFLQTQQESPDSLLIKFKEMLSKYRFMETHTVQRAQALEAKVPEIRKSVEILEHLHGQHAHPEGTHLSFELEDTLYCKAHIPKQSNNLAYIWLGANVMVEYPVQEALQMLQEKIVSCNQILQSLEEDKLFLREQMTTIEVNIARLYNWAVRNK